MDIDTERRTRRETRQVPIDRSEVLARVRQCLAAVIGKPVETVSYDAILVDLGAQSFDFVHLVARLNQTFDVELPETYAMPDRHSVDDYVTAVEEALTRSGGVVAERAADQTAP